jgi:putative acetyltransferase
MAEIIRTDSSNTGFLALVKLLDDELLGEYGEQQTFYDQFNQVIAINQVIVALVDDQPAACGAIKKFDENTAEVKRMFVKPEHRGKQIAKTILLQLELWASELGYTYCILETGTKQERAIALYQKNGYEVIANYGQYLGIETSICFKKRIK